ncbi:Tat pathway signal sequence domain protein [Actinacidiphila glaucinigra]|uniref:Tat pathway signal sequence domain protein n=1 Tax=Actinacidiphila glaucinigra TaxID=235986 RepID=UPI002DD7D8A6|nr:Tat pathway signal sequence domain protein [Actinacidiphila glaucinigra]WSD59555.1 Tat pathway signal sequence domain protein [Actinacidiphila glaucinigra]
MTDQGESRSLPQKGGLGRGIRRALWGGGTAVLATAVMIGITLPRDASGDDHSPRGGPAAAPGAPGRQDAGSGDVTEDEAPEGARQSGRGPLTKAEVDRAKSIALRRDALRSAQDVDGGRGPEYLDTDLAEPADATGARTDRARRVEVLFYDYGHDRLVKKTVDLTSGTVERTDTATGLQPPPSNDETREAAALLIRDALGTGLRADFTAATKGRDLASPDQLRLRGISFNTAEQSAPAGLAKCGRHRCVRLFTQVKDGPWIDTTHLVVDLSDRTVGRIH